MEIGLKRPLMISRGWVQAAAVVLIIGFFILGVLTYSTYHDEPPIPDVVKSADGSTLFTRADIMAGQQIFLGNGLMEYGSIFGHGAYLGPDFTTEYLHQAALSSIEFYGGANSDRARSRTAGFTYRREHDIWKCPQDQHLFPVFSDSARGITIYRAPAGACDTCPSKAACTDSSDGREIEHRTLSEVESGMKRFHHAISLTLLALASLILVVELFRVEGSCPRIVLALTVTLFWILIQRLSTKLSQGTRQTEMSHNGRLYSIETRPS